MDPNTPQGIEPIQNRIRDHFPFSEIRDPQARALEAVERAEEKDKRFIILELPTGVGKSGIAIAIASWAAKQKHTGFGPGGYILTTQKSLQSQYMKDFESMGLLELKGASNYHCDKWNTDCSSGSKLSKAVKAWDEEEEGCGFACPYKQAKYYFKVGTTGITNFAYFLNETKYVNMLKPRSALVIDEAHNAEKEILSFADIEITKARCEFIGVSNLPFFQPGDNQKVYDWINNVYGPAGALKEAELEAQMRDAAIRGDDEESLDIARKHDALDKFLCKVRRFSTTPEDLKNWFVFSEEKTGNLHIKPLVANFFAEELLFKQGRRIYMMSATILDRKTFTRNLGMNEASTGFLSLDSDFPIENRLVYFYPSGKMGHKYIDQSLPGLIQRVEKILAKHSQDKGIIHCNSYKIQKAILDHFEGTETGRRLLSHNSLNNSRERAIVEHATSQRPTVLISPSMTEGLDLKDDLGRFQVICKIPYPNLGDLYINTRKNLDPSWYQWQTALTLVQATGRTTRSKSDYSTSYILDSDFTFFLKTSEKILPNWWKRALVLR